MTDKTPLKVLLLEDSEEDARALLDVLACAGFEVEFERVNAKKGMLSALDHGAGWDLIVSEQAMPDFSFTDTLQALQTRGLSIPLIIVSDDITEETAIELWHAGIHDYFPKGDLAHLGVSVIRALHGAQSRAEAMAYQQRLRELVSHMEEVHECERVDIARQVHDELGGMLTAIKLDLSELGKRCRECHAGAKAPYQRLGEHIDMAINTVRRIISDLRPSVLDELGLVAALEWQLNEFEKRYQIDCLFTNQASELTLGEKGSEVAVFRIFQEALNNIAKHAGASRVEVRLATENNTLLLQINDNGVGICEEYKLKEGHCGILGMNERMAAIGGSLGVCAPETGGTRVGLWLPLQQEGKS